VRAVAEVELADLEVDDLVEVGLAQALVEPAGPRRQHDDLVVIGDQGGHAQHGPGLGHRGQRDLDDRHADDAALVTDGVGQKVARLAAGVADREVAPHLARQRANEVGPKGQVFADEAAGLARVAAGHHHPTLVEHVHRQAAKLGVELVQVEVDGGCRGRPAARAQQGHHVAVELDRGRHMFEPVEHAFEGRGEQVQAVGGVGAHRVEALVPAGLVAQGARPHDGHGRGQGQRHHARPRRHLAPGPGPRRRQQGLGGGGGVGRGLRHGGQSGRAQG
jgi:hypothetical protein